MDKVNEHSYECEKQQTATRIGEQARSFLAIDKSTERSRLEWESAINEVDQKIFKLI